MKTLFALLIVVALAFGGWFGLGPYRTVQKLTQALEAEDPAAVDLYVDFDAVRASLSNDFVLRLGAQPQGQGMGDRVATSLAGAFVSMIVSPPAMVTVFKNHDRRVTMGLSSNLADLLGRGDWVNPSLFMLKNAENQPTMLLFRTGTRWEVTAIRLK